MCLPLTALAAEPGFGQGPTRPREALLVPAGELSEGDAVAGGVDEPVVAEVDARVIDVVRLRASAGGAPEENVSRLQTREGNALRRRHFAAHGKGRPALQGGCERALAGVGLELVNAPHEAGAVEAAGRLDAEGRLLGLARAAPHVRIADEPNRGFQDSHLPGRVRWQFDALGELGHLLGLPVAETQDLRRRVGGLGTRRRLAGE